MRGVLRKQKEEKLPSGMVYCHVEKSNVKLSVCSERTKEKKNNTIHCTSFNCCSSQRICWACLTQGTNGASSRVTNPNTGLCGFHDQYGFELTKKDFVPGTAAEKKPAKPAPAAVPIVSAKEEKVVITDQGKKYLAEIDIDMIDPNPRQPRKYFDETAIAELQQSMRVEGQKIEIRVVKMPNGRYMIKEGETRWISAKRNGEKKIWAVVDPYLGEEQLLIDSFVCNFGRKGHEAFEVALALKEWRSFESMKDLDEDEFLLKAAKKVGKGKSLSWVKNHYSLLKLPPSLFKRLHPKTPEKERLLFSAALELVKEKVPMERREALGMEIIQKKMTGRAAKMHIHKKIGGKQQLGGRGRPSDDAEMYRNCIAGTHEKVQFLISFGAKRLEKMLMNKPEAVRQELIDLHITTIDLLKEVLEKVGGQRRWRQRHSG